VAVVLGAALHAGAEVNAGAGAEVVALIVRGDGAAVVTGRACGCEGVAALSCHRVTFSSFMALSGWMARHVVATPMASAQTRGTLILDRVCILVITLRALWLLWVRTLSCLNVAHADIVTAILGFAHDTLAQIFSGTDTTAVAFVIHRQGASIITLKVLRCKRVATFSSLFVASTNLVALTLRPACHILTTRVASADTRFALIVDSQGLMVVAHCAIRRLWLRTDACIHVTNAGFVTAVLGDTCDTLAQVLPGTDTVAITLVVHGKRAQIVASFVQRSNRIAACAGGWIALSYIMALALSMACHVFASGMAVASSRCALIIDCVRVFVIARCTVRLGWFRAFACLGAANPSFMTLVLC